MLRWVAVLVDVVVVDVVDVDVTFQGAVQHD